VNRTIIVTTLFLGMVVAASADGQSSRRTAAETPSNRPVCIVEVLQSEELPGAPIFQNLVRATLRITSADHPPFETTVVRLIPWQVPPPRRGQRIKSLCDPSALSSLTFH
jgi:hypothetical protein